MAKRQTIDRLYAKLGKALEHIDCYDPVPSDDTPIYAMGNDECLFEFAHDTGVLCVGDLRDMFKVLSEVL